MHRRQISRRGLAEQVDVATDGLAALDYLRECATGDTEVPELILLDINMPRMNGFEFLDAYGELPTGLRDRQRIVMVSTSTLRRDKARAEEYPFVTAFETKPLSDADLERIVCGGQPGSGRPIA
jgi:CheY-like chemotaxis protein